MRITIVAVLVFFCLPSEAQELSIGLEGGYGFYNMSSLREKEAISDGNPIPFSQVQNFPATPLVRAFARARIGKIWSTGIALGYMRTGSRSAYSDYSGSAYRDVVVNGFQLGSSNLFQVYKIDNYFLNARLGIGANFSSTRFEQSLILNATSYSEQRTSTFTSINPYFLFGADITRKLGRFTLAVFAEYEVNGLGDTKLKSSNLNTPPPSDFDVDWSGARIGISGAYRFAKEP